jgi:hypothetical protein
VPGAFAAVLVSTARDIAVYVELSLDPPISFDRSFSSTR